MIVLERTPRRPQDRCADPTNVIALDDVRAYTGASELQLVVATDSQIRDEIARAWALSEDSGDFDAIVSDIEATPATDEPDISAVGTDDAPTVRLVNSILGDAVRCGASDIHVEPQRDALRVRYRVDGLLRDIMTVPRSAAAAVVSRIKIISGLDIAERRRAAGRPHPADRRRLDGRRARQHAARRCTARRSSSGCSPARRRCSR